MKTKENTDLYSPLEHSSRISCLRLVFFHHFWLQKRSLRERTKKKNYKEDFDYNLSEEDEKKKENQDEKESENKTLEPVISGGANEFVAYRPNLEKEGEIAIIEKILAMRTRQDEVWLREQLFIVLKSIGVYF